MGYIKKSNPTTAIVRKVMEEMAYTISFSGDNLYDKFKSYYPSDEKVANKDTFLTIFRREMKKQGTHCLWHCYMLGKNSYYVKNPPKAEYAMSMDCDCEWTNKKPLDS